MTGGGFRVRRRVSSPSGISPPVERTYIYTDENGQTTGLGHKPEFVSSFLVEGGSYFCQGTVIHSHSPTTLGSEGTVQYRRVTVREGPNGEYGETIYRFYIHLNFPAGGEGEGFFPGAMTNHNWRSVMIGETYRDANENPVREVNYANNPVRVGEEADQSWAVAMRTFCVVLVRGEPFPGIPIVAIFPAYYNTYNVQSGRNWLMTTQEITYDEP